MGGLKAMKNLAGSCNQGWRENTRPRTAMLGGALWSPLCIGLEARLSAGWRTAKNRGAQRGVLVLLLNRIRVY